jgi:hypothetical protein
MPGMTRSAVSPDTHLRAAKPPFYRNIIIRHPVNPLTPIRASRLEALRSMAPCVVMGRGHSGTRLIAWMCVHLGLNFGTSARVPSGDPDDHSFKHHVRVVATHGVDVHHVEETNWTDRNRFRKAVFGFHRRIGAPRQRWGWKFPETYLAGPYVLDAFPRARFIHLLRDGRDVAFKRHLTDVAAHRLARAILSRQEALSLPHHIQAALSWAFQVEAFEAFARTVAPHRLLNLRFEDVVLHPQDTAQAIATFLGVPMTEACRAYIDAEVDGRRAGSFRDHPPDLVREIEAAIGPALERHGYMTSDRNASAG